MSKTTDIKTGSIVFDRINTIRMSAAERQIAINAMRDADFVIDAFVWVSRKIEQVTERLYHLILKPSLKH